MFVGSAARIFSARAWASEKAPTARSARPALRCRVTSSGFRSAARTSCSAASLTSFCCRKASPSFTRASAEVPSAWTAFLYSMTASATLPCAIRASPLLSVLSRISSGSDEQLIATARHAETARVNRFFILFALRPRIAQGSQQAYPAESLVVVQLDAAVDSERLRPCGPGAAPPRRARAAPCQAAAWSQVRGQLERRQSYLPRS